MDNTDVSIIIPVYNGALLLNRCLDSVFNQDGVFDLEVIVINDGSTDDSLEIVKKYPRFVNLLQQTNLGPAAARNKGIEAATGKYLAFLDADDYWKPDFLKSTVGFLEKHPEAIAVSVGQIHKIPGKPDSIVPNVLLREPAIFVEPIILENFFVFWAEHNHICTGSVLMRTYIVKQSGGQRPDLRITEDLEFWGYLATFGQWGFIPKILFVSDGSIVTRQTGWMEKNKKRWASAPTIDEWEKRIIQKLKPTFPIGYMKVRGRIARNLAYSQLLSGREKMARKTILENINNLPSDKLTRLIAAAAKFTLIWKIFCNILYYRELNRIL